METQLVLRKLKLGSGMGLLAIGLITQAHAGPYTCGANCNIPANADCATFQELVIKDPLQGSAVPHTGIVIANPSQSGDWDPIPVTFSDAFTDTHAISGSVTLNYTTSAQVQASVLGAATATAGCSASVSGTGAISGGYTTTLTLTAGPVWLYWCDVATWTVTGDYKTGVFSTDSYLKDYWYPTGWNIGDPIQSTTCQQATGQTMASNEFYNISAKLSVVSVCDYD